MNDVVRLVFGIVGRTSQTQMNGLIHHGASSGTHLPPPPPGFVQPGSTHMNSFGSKILPYLNMNSNGQQAQPSPQQQMGSVQQNGWPNYGQMQTQHKGESFSFSIIFSFILLQSLLLLLFLIIIPRPNETISISLNYEFQNYMYYFL